MTTLPDTRAEEPSFERIVAVAPARATADAPRPVSPPYAERQVSGAAVMIGLAVFVLIAVAVFTFLSWPEAKPSPQETAAPADAVLQPASEPATETPPAPAANQPAAWDDPELLRARQAAQDAAAEFETKLASLRGHAVERWAASELSAAEATREKGRVAFEARDYKPAADAHQRSLRQLDTLLARVPAELTQALQRAGAALDRGDGVAATAAYELALAIEPGNAAATRGLQRVQAMPQVQTALGEARAAETAGQMEAAAERYRAALKLDSESAAAQTGLQRVQARIADAAFQRAMAEGLAALDRGDHASAQAAYLRAQKIRGDSPAVREGLARAGLGMQNTRIAGLLAEAQVRESAEDWSGAAERYGSALKTDPTLAQAKTGFDRATARAALSSRMNAHVQNAQRLQSENVYADAQAALAEARAIPAKGSLLNRQIAALEQTLSLAATPVTVRLQSDNATEVTVYKVGDLGKFSARELSLKPGRYVAVGTRAGYRDVRREFVVAGEGAGGAVVVRCEERI